VICLLSYYLRAIYSKRMELSRGCSNAGAKCVPGDAAAEPAAHYRSRRDGGEGKQLTRMPCIKKRV
jgi:hypothetical protein